MNLTSTVSTSSSSVTHPIASRSRGTLKASAGKPDARARRNSKPDAASSSQGRLKDAYLGGLMVEVAEKPAATDKSQESWEFFWFWILEQSPEKKWQGNLLRPEIQEIQRVLKAGSRKWPHNFHMSPADNQPDVLVLRCASWSCFDLGVEIRLRSQHARVRLLSLSFFALFFGRRHLWRFDAFVYSVRKKKASVFHSEKVYSIVRKFYGLSPTEELNDFDVNTVVRSIFMNVTHQAAVETIWRIHDLPRINSWSQWNSYSKWLNSWSWIRQKSVVWPRLIIENVRGDRRLYYVSKRIKLRMPKPMCSTTRCSVWDVSVTNQSKLGRTNGIWKIAIVRIWIELMESWWEFEWKIFPGFTTLGILEVIHTFYDWSTVWTWTIQRKDHLHVNVKRHCMERTKKHWKMWDEFCYSYELCSQIPARTLVILGTWIREKVVRDLLWWTRWKMGQDCWTSDAQFCRKRSSYLSCHQRLGKRTIKKQRKGTEVRSLQRIWFFARLFL